MREGLEVSRKKLSARPPDRSCEYEDRAVSAVSFCEQPTGLVAAFGRFPRGACHWRDRGS